MGNTCSVEEAVNANRRKHLVAVATESRAVGTSPMENDIQLRWDRDPKGAGFARLFESDEGAANAQDTRVTRRAAPVQLLHLNPTTRLLPHGSTTSTATNDASSPAAPPESGGSALSVYRNDALSSTRELKSLNSIISNTTASNTIGPSVGGLTACSVMSMASDMYLAETKRGGALQHVSSTSRIQFGSFASSAVAPNSDVSATLEGCNILSTTTQEQQQDARRSILSSLQGLEPSSRPIMSCGAIGTVNTAPGDRTEKGSPADATATQFSLSDDEQATTHNDRGNDSSKILMSALKPPPLAVPSAVSPVVSPTHSDLMMAMTPPNSSSARLTGGSNPNWRGTKTLSPCIPKLDPQTPPSRQSSLSRKRGVFASPPVGGPPGAYQGQSSCSSGGAIRLQGSGCSIKSLESHKGHGGGGSVVSVKIAQLSNGSGRPIRGSFSASVSASHPLSIDELSTLNNSVIARDAADGDVSLPCFDSGCNFLKGEDYGQLLRPQAPKDLGGVVPARRRGGGTSHRRPSASETQETTTRTLYSSELFVEFQHGSGDSYMFLSGGGEVALNAAAPFQMFQCLDASAAAVGSQSLITSPSMMGAPRDKAKSLGSSFDNEPNMFQQKGERGHFVLDVVGIREKSLQLNDVRQASHFDKLKSEKALHQASIECTVELTNNRNCGVGESCRSPSGSSLHEYLPAMAPLDDEPCAPLLELF